MVRQLSLTEDESDVLLLLKDMPKKINLNPASSRIEVCCSCKLLLHKASYPGTNPRMGLVPENSFNYYVSFPNTLTILFVILSNCLYQFILMNAGTQALTDTVLLTLPPLIRSMPVPPIEILLSVELKITITLFPVCESVFVIISVVPCVLRSAVPRQRAGFSERALNTLAT